MQGILFHALYYQRGIILSRIHGIVASCAIRAFKLHHEHQPCHFGVTHGAVPKVPVVGKSIAEGLTVG